MPMVVDFSHLPEGTPVWLTIVFLIMAVFLTFSERLAKLANPIGWIARRWQNRQILAVERAESLDKAIEDAVARRVKDRMAPILEDLQALRDRLDIAEQDVSEIRQARREDQAAHAREIDTYQEKVRIRDAYIVHVASWYRSLRIWAAEEGIPLPPPDLTPFREWTNQFRRNNQ